VMPGNQPFSAFAARHGANSRQMRAITAFFISPWFLKAYKRDLMPSDLSGGLFLIIFYLIFERNTYK